MGYYSTIEHSLKVKEGFIPAIRFAWSKIKENPKSQPEFYLYFDDMEIKDDGTIQFDSDSYKRYHDDKFADWIREYVEGELHFQGEDGEEWGYLFKDGKHSKLKCVKEWVELME